MSAFDRSEHVYVSPNLDEIINDTIRFFNGTPVREMPVSERFEGTGVYAIYSIARSGIYSKFHAINRTAFHTPIYIGKAVPCGWRQARLLSSSQVTSYELSSRLREHSRSLGIGAGLSVSDFFCRFMILENQESDLIGTVEAALIRKYRPIWNTLIDGFGNHDPGKGRYEQAKSDWDVCHPGRSWAEKCRGIPAHQSNLYKSIERFLDNLEAEDA